jgi:hypothetical protein
MARIGLDLLCLAGERTGMGWQAYWLAHHLARLAPEHTFVHFLPDGLDAPVTGANVEVRRVATNDRRGDRIVAEQWRLPRAAGAARLDLLHTIAYGPPWLYRGRKLLTIHDLALWRLPETVPARWRRYWRWAYGVAGRECRPLIAVSECTKHDVVNFLNCPVPSS